MRESDRWLINSDLQVQGILGSYLKKLQNQKSDIQDTLVCKVCINIHMFWIWNMVGTFFAVKNKQVCSSLWLKIFSVSPSYPSVCSLELSLQENIWHTFWWGENIQLVWHLPLGAFIHEVILYPVFWPTFSNPWTSWRWTYCSFEKI